jgi:hypothetical protein
MSGSQPINRLFTLGLRYPGQVAVVRVAVGVWLLALTIILHNEGQGGEWAWLLVPAALVNLALAYRLLRIAHTRR